MRRVVYGAAGACTYVSRMMEPRGTSVGIDLIERRRAPLDSARLMI